MKNKILSCVVIFALIIVLMTVSASALSFTATMTASATTVAEESEFAVKIKVSNLDVGSNGINSLNGYLKYDAEVFEAITESSIEGLNGWTATFDETTGKIGLTKSSFVTSAQEVINIAFKTKAGVSGKSGTISFSNIVASNSESDISATDISTSITIGTAEGNGNTNTAGNTITIQPTNTSNTANKTNTTNIINAINTNTANNTTNNTTNNTSNNAVSSYVNTMSNTTSDESMPETGVDDTVLMLVFVAIGVAIMFYVKIEKLNKDIR